MPLFIEIRFLFTKFISEYILIFLSVFVKLLNLIYFFIKLFFNDETNVGFVFDYDAKAVDLETIYELKGLKGNKSNVAKREFLFNPSLYLYIDDLEFKKYFKNPAYPILLGRSSDLAIISEIKEIEMEKKNNVKLGKTILPFGIEGAFGIIQALPTHFSDSIPRKAIGTKPYLLMNQFFDYSGDCYFDSELNWGVWIHK